MSSLHLLKLSLNDNDILAGNEEPKSMEECMLKINGCTYKCKLCSYQSTSSLVRRHLMTKHSADENMACDFCGRSFKNRYGYNRHFKRSSCKPKLSSWKNKCVAHICTWFWNFTFHKCTKWQWRSCRKWRVQIYGGVHVENQCQHIQVQTLHLPIH